MLGGQLRRAEAWVSSTVSAYRSTVPRIHTGRGASSGHGATLHPPLPSGKELLEVGKIGLSPPAQNVQHLRLFAAQERHWHCFTFIISGLLKEGTRWGRSPGSAPSVQG